MYDRPMDAGPLTKMLVIKVSADLHTALKSVAQAKGESMSTYVRETLRREVAARRKQARKIIASRKQGKLV